MKIIDFNSIWQVSLWMPIVFVVVLLVLMIVPVVSEPVAVIAGALITLAGVPVYFIVVREQPKYLTNVSGKSHTLCSLNIHSFLLILSSS